MVHPWIDVSRDAGGDLVDIGVGPIREAWTQMEISRCSPVIARQLDREVRAAVANVQLVVSDSDAMFARASALAEELLQHPADGHTISEADQVAKLLSCTTG